MTEGPRLSLPVIDVTIACESSPAGCRECRVIVTTRTAHSKALIVSGAGYDDLHPGAGLRGRRAHARVSKVKFTGLTPTLGPL